MSEEGLVDEIGLKDDVVLEVLDNLENRIEGLQEFHRHDIELGSGNPTNEQVNKKVVQTIAGSDGELKLVGLTGKSDDGEQVKIASVVASRLKELNPQEAVDWAEREEDGFNIRANQKMLIEAINGKE